MKPKTFEEFLRTCTFEPVSAADIEEAYLAGQQSVAECVPVEAINCGATCCAALDYPQPAADMSAFLREVEAIRHE